jgi:hypothetical protein
MRKLKNCKTKPENPRKQFSSRSSLNDLNIVVFGRATLKFPKVYRALV